MTHASQKSMASIISVLPPTVHTASELECLKPKILRNSTRVVSYQNLTTEMECCFLRKSMDCMLDLTGPSCPMTVAIYGSVTHPILFSGAGRNACSNADCTVIG